MLTALLSGGLQVSGVVTRPETLFEEYQSMPHVVLLSSPEDDAVVMDVMHKLQRILGMKDTGIEVDFQTHAELANEETAAMFLKSSLIREAFDADPEIRVVCVQFPSRDDGEGPMSVKLAAIQANFRAKMECSIRDGWAFWQRPES